VTKQLGAVRDGRVHCASCEGEMPTEGPLIFRWREGGIRVWGIVHECGTGPWATLNLGTCPKPTNRVQTFVYHLCHGLIMRYGVWSVLWFSWRNRANFDADDLDREWS